MIRGTSNVRNIECSAVLAYVTIGVIYTFIILPYLMSAYWFINMNPVSAYIIWNIGYVMLFAGIFGTATALLTGKGANILSMIKDGIAGFLLFSFVFDSLQPQEMRR